jgi:hypothetical protein
MVALLDQVEAADALVLGAPVNFGNVNALTRRFLERTICYGYWPWDAPAPLRRGQAGTKPAVLVTTSAAPALLGRWTMGAMKALQQLADMLGAKPIHRLWMGMVNPQEKGLPPRYQRLTQRLGQRLRVDDGTAPHPHGGADPTRFAEEPFKALAIGHNKIAGDAGSCIPGNSVLGGSGVGVPNTEAQRCRFLDSRRECRLSRSCPQCPHP